MLRAAWPGLMVLAAAGVAGPMLAGLPAWTASLFALVSWATAIGLSWRAAGRLQPFTDTDAARRMEAKAGLAELAPLTGGNDRAALGDGGLWLFHQQQLAEAAGRLDRPANPAPDSRDGLRLAGLAVALGLVAIDPVGAARGLNPDLSPLAGDSQLALEAWAEPPAHTGLPTVRLSRDAASIALPVGSALKVRVDGARGAPVLRGPFSPVRLTRGVSGAWEGSVRLERGGAVRIDRLGERARWTVTLTPDKAPEVKLAAPISIDPRGRLSLDFTASDDFAVTGAMLRVRLIDPPDGLRLRPTLDTPIPLDGQAQGEGGARRVFLDVADHPFTGLEVEARIVARDALGQEGQSEASRIVLPARRWSNQLAAALQEQRLAVLREARPWSRWPVRGAELYDGQADLPVWLDLSEPARGAPPGVARALDLMGATLRAGEFAGFDLGSLLAVRIAYGQLQSARSPDEAHAAAQLLWPLALRADSGGRSPAQQRLDEARDALEQALRDGASPEQLRELTEEMRQAMQQRIQELAREAQERSGNGEAGQGGQAGGEGLEDQGGEQVSGGDLEDMLRRMEEAGSQGAREEALQALGDIGRLMENLRVNPDGQGQPGESGSGQGSGGNGQPAPADRALREQRDLADETDARAQSQPAPDAGPGSADDLAARQEDLADRVSPPGAAQNRPGSQSRTEAARAMRDAAEALRRGDFERAQALQGQAMAALRRAQGQGRQAGGDDDPLGRPGADVDDGTGTRVPDGTERRRARDVRDELRRRQGEAGRGDAERGYLDRLLKDRE